MAVFISCNFRLQINGKVNIIRKNLNKIEVLILISRAEHLYFFISIQAKSKQMQGSVLSHDLRKVISLVDLLRDIGLDKLLSLPKVVVLGNQSSGKSSLLQQIVGLDFLPRGSGVVTRRPLQLRMNNVPDLPAPYAEFDEVVENGKKKRFVNFNEVRKTIDEVTDKVCGKSKVIVDNPIVLNVFSPNCPNLTLVDLPGITAIPVGDQPKNIYEITKDMAMRYIKEPRSIILCVIPANQDLSTSESLKIMREIDPSGERSVGCLTKIDIMNRGDDARNILKNIEIPLRYGYVGIKNRCQEDVTNNVPVTESLKSQKQFFTSSPIYSTLPPGTFGTQSLTHKLTTILYQQIKASMPQIFQQIKKKRHEAQQQLDKLGPGVASTDAEMVNYAWKSISSFLRIYLNSINGIKNTDYQNDPISSQIREELNNLYKEEYDEAATEDLSDKDIERAMINFPGDSTIPGFPSIDAFLALLNPLLKKLQQPAYKINNKIHQLMEQQAVEIVDKIMTKKFPEFNVRFSDLIKRVLQKHRRDLQSYLNSLLDAQLSYLYTNDISYLMNDFGLTNEEKKKLESGKIRDPLIFELRKRIDSYFKLVVRNLRDLIPKQIFNFLMTKCLKQMEFEAFQFTSDVNKLKEWLNEPAEVRNKRIECVKAIKVFEQSQKKIRMDPQISKLVRNTQRESKYYKKFGMKTPQELEREQLEKQKTIYQSKADETFKKKPQPKGGDSGGDRVAFQKQDSANVPNNVPKKVEPVVQEPKKTAGFANMFGDAPKKQPEIYRQPPPQPPQNKDTNINTLFGTGPVQKNDTPNNKSPVPQKKQMNFNFEDAWKAEQAKQTPTQRVQPIISPTQPKNPMMNNIPKPPEPQKVDNVPPKDVEKKKATFNNLFGLK